MCMNPLKAAPYAIGGLLGGTALKSAFGGNGSSKKKPGELSGTLTTKGVVG
jgi:hypothetical protein